MLPELSFSYDANICPVAGKCTACGEPMPAPPSEPCDTVDTILWLSHHFIVHKQLKHPTPRDYDADDKDAPQP